MLDMCIPNLFTKKPIPEKLPASMQKKIEILKKTKSKEECLRKAYDIMHERFWGWKWRTFSHLGDVFRYLPEQSWNRKGFIHCTHMCYLLRILLVRSGWFKEEDIKPKITTVHYLSIHQYLKVRIGKDEYAYLDIWGASYGVPYGKYSNGLNCNHRTDTRE